MAASTQEVLDHHLQSFGAGDVEGMLADYTDQSIVITPAGVLRGKQAISDAFTAVVAEFSKPGMTFSMDAQTVEGDIAFIAWTAETADNVYDMGTDTFLIQDGKIVTQTFVTKTTPKS